MTIEHTQVSHLRLIFVCDVCQARHDVHTCVLCHRQACVSHGTAWRLDALTPADWYCARCWAVGAPYRAAQEEARRAYTARMQEVEDAWRAAGHPARMAAPAPQGGPHAD